MEPGRTSKLQTASSEVVRDINKRTVRNLIRTRHPISRADLARLCGLQRSTVSLIVEQLIEENWVLEGPTGRLPRGRRPTFLRLNEERVIIGVDIRPIQTTVATADVNCHFISQEAFPTPKDPHKAMSVLVDSVQRLRRSCAGKKVEGIGVSVPGRYDHSAGQLVFAPNLDWAGFDVRGPIMKATGLEVEVEKAANACVYASVWFDRNEPKHDLVVVTVSEGIGTGMLVNGQVIRGLKGMAGEFGHVPIESDGPACGCGGRGCWEVFASNRAALRYYSETGKGGSNLTFIDLLRRADQADADAVEALQRMAHYLGRGLRMVVAGLAPERIVLIGDLTQSWNRFGPAIEAEVSAQALQGGAAPLIVPAHESGMARLRGTVALVLEKHFGVFE